MRINIVLNTYQLFHYPVHGRRPLHTSQKQFLVSKSHRVSFTAKDWTQLQSLSTFVVSQSNSKTHWHFVGSHPGKSSWLSCCYSSSTPLLTLPKRQQNPVQLLNQHVNNNTSCRHQSKTNCTSVSHQMRLSPVHFQVTFLHSSGCAHSCRQTCVRFNVIIYRELPILDSHLRTQFWSVLCLSCSRLYLVLCSFQPAPSPPWL